MGLADQVVEVIAEANRVADDIEAALHLRGSPGWLTKAAGNFAFTIMVLGGELLTLIVGVMVLLAPGIMVKIVESIEQLRPEDADTFNRLAATSINAYLNTNITPAELGRPFANDGGDSLHETIGSKIFALLETKFAPDGSLSPEQGNKAAQRFTGYGIDLSVEDALQSTLIEVFGVGQLESWGKLGDGIRENMGFNRLARRSLGNLIETTIGIPYDWYLNRKYRPTRLNKAEAVRAFSRGEFDAARLRRELREMGYADDLIESIIRDNERTNSVADLARLQRFGMITEEEAVVELISDGMTDKRARLRLQAQHLSRAESRVNELINLYEGLVRDGLMDLQTAELAIARLPMSDIDRRWQLQLMGEIVETVRKDLTLAQVRQAFLDGIIGLTEVESYLRRQRYTPQAELVLVLQFLLDLLEKTNKEKAKEKVAEGIRSKASQIIDDATRNTILGGSGGS